MTYPTESALQRAVVKALRAKGYWVIVTDASRPDPRAKRNLERGIPDLHLVGLGWLELKREGHALDPDQIEWHRNAKILGVKTWTVDSVEEALSIAGAWADDAYLMPPLRAVRRNQIVWEAKRKAKRAKKARAA